MWTPATAGRPCWPTTCGRSSPASNAPTRSPRTRTSGSTPRCSAAARSCATLASRLVQRDTSYSGSTKRRAACTAFDYVHQGPDFSRGFAALRIWLSLLAHGRVAYGRRISHDAALARYLGELVEEHPDFELMTPVKLSICCFRYAPAALRGDQAALDRLNERIMTAIHTDGRVYCSNAVFDGRFSLRACIVNFRTEGEHVELLVEVAAEHGESPVGSGGAGGRVSENRCEWPRSPQAPRSPAAGSSPWRAAAAWAWSTAPPSSRSSGTVALKVIAPELADDADFRERFKRESRLAASIEHPNVIPVYEAGEADGLLYLIMRFVEGPTCAPRSTRTERSSPLAPRCWWARWRRHSRRRTGAGSSTATSSPRTC